MPDNAQIQGIEFEIKGSANKAAKSLDKLAAALGKVKSESSGFEKLTQAVSSLAEATSQMNAGGLKALNSALGRIGKTEGALASVTEHLTNIAGLDFSNLTNAAQLIGKLAMPAKSGSKKSVDSLTPQTSGMTEEISETASGASTSVGKLGAAMEEAGNKSSKFVSALSSAVPLLSSLGRGAAKAAKNFAKLSGNVIAAPFKHMANSVSDAIKGLAQFGSAIKRIMLYRAIRATIKEITKAIKEGIDNLVEYSRIVGTDFHNAMDSIATDAQYIKNSFAAVSAPILQAIAPVFRQIADEIANAMNLLAQFLAMLSGKATYTKAVRSMKEYATATDKAKKALKQFTLGIDELNTLPSASGGGGAGGGFGEMFEESAIDLSSKMADFANSLKDAIKAGDWKGVGQIIGDKLNEVVSKIDAHGIGQKIGNIINNGIQMVYSFLKTANFIQIGQKIGEFITGAMEKIDFATAGALWVRKFTALLDIVVGAIKGINWKLVGESIANFINGAVKEAAQWISDTNFTELVNKITTGLNTMIKRVNWKEAGKLFGNLFKTILDSALEFVQTFDWAGLGKTIGDFITGINWGELILKLVEIGALLIKGLLEGIGGMMLSIGSWLKQNVVDPIVNWVKNLFGIHSPSTVFAEIGVDLVLGLFNGISQTWHVVVDFFTTTLANLLSMFNEKWTAIKQKTLEVWATIKENTLATWNTIKQTLSERWETLRSTAAEKFETIRVKIEEKWANIKDDTNQTWDNIKSMLSETWATLKDSAQEKFEDIREKLAEKWSSVKDDTITKWDEIKSSLSTTWDEIKSNGIGAFTDFQQTVDKIWKDLWDGIKFTINAIIGGVEKMANAVINGINAVIRSMNRLSFKMPDWLGGGSFGFSIRELSQISIPRLAQGGSVDYGQLFLARENGPELVANANNRTNVMNNDDIVQSVSNGVRDANEDIVTAVYAIGSMIVRAIESESGNGDLDSAARALYPYFKSIDKAQGASFV